MTYQSPISPGVSWYEKTVTKRPAYAAMDGSRQADVAIIGGGFTGLQAACNLAKAGTDVTLIEAYRFGDGASGRNGGQMGTGQRWFPEELEGELGFDKSKALFDLAEDAKRYLMDFAASHGIDMDYLPGQMNVSHKQSYEKEYRESVIASAERYGYTQFSFMERAETEERVGSKRYHFGIRDIGTGHIHPMKLIVGLARVAADVGANVFENTPARKIRKEAGGFVIETANGDITAKRVLIACNAHIDGLEPVTSAHVMPIRSFIGTTEPLDNFPEVIPGKEAIADSRFVVRYFRKTADNRLLFGGREAYTADYPRDITVHIRRQITEIYPQLANIAITDAWGGSVGITLNRQPFAREIMPGLTALGGYSGHGVMLSNYCGKLYADAVLGNTGQLDLLKSLKVVAFPGGPRLRKPLLLLALTWYSLIDKL